jgi:sugar phosphate isomerase/epimerase
MRRFEISLAAWSLHRLFRDGRITQLDLPRICRDLDIGGLELINGMFPSPQYRYLKELRQRAADAGVTILLIMCDHEGDFTDLDARERRLAVRNHRKWLDVAAVLGCHSIRCNTGKPDPSDRDAIARCAESLAALVELARPDGLNVLIENHWGLSSSPDAILDIIRRVDDPLLGTLPDFGNWPPEVDRYEATRRLMPYARAVSAKCNDFDAQGDETRIDYQRMTQIVLDSGYRGWVGIEYEGENPDELWGVSTCKKLLERFQRAST